MTERTITGMSNYYGFLRIKTEARKYWMGLDNFDGVIWKEIPRSLYRELVKYVDDHERKSMLSFAREYPGWHSFSQDVLTLRAAKGLAKKGLIEINEFGQFRLKEKK